MSEQERFEQSVAARLHPARFTKVGENPLLGWNGAKDSDYVNTEMQRHWTTWQAATAKTTYKQIGFVHLKRWQAGNAPEHCFSTEKEQYGDVEIYVKEQNHD